MRWIQECCQCLVTEESEEEQDVQVHAGPPALPAVHYLCDFQTVQGIAY